MSWEVISLSTFRSCGAILRAPKRRTSTKSIIGGENAGGFGIPNKTRGNLSFYAIDETQIASRFL